MLEKFKENSKLIAHGNDTEHLQATAQTEIKPQASTVAKQSKQKLWPSSKAPDSVKVGLQGKATGDSVRP